MLSREAPPQTSASLCPQVLQGAAAAPDGAAVAPAASRASMDAAAAQAQVGLLERKVRPRAQAKLPSRPAVP
jgi:hypothetical protein